MLQGCGLRGRLSTHLQQGHGFATSGFRKGHGRSGLPSGSTTWLLIPEVQVSPEALPLISATAHYLD